MRVPRNEKAAAFTGSGLILCARLAWCYGLRLQVAHEAEGVQEPQDAPAPAITPSPPMAEKSEIIRCVFSLPHFGQAMGASASTIARSTSKHVSQSEHLYSYSGIASTSSSAFSALQAYCTAV